MYEADRLKVSWLLSFLLLPENLLLHTAEIAAIISLFITGQQAL
jgi:hypothetical protein